jgi:hypothetical protein
MKKEELYELDKSLKHFGDFGSILTKKRGFYLYYNEPTKSTKEVNIHSHTCGFCKWGSGSGKQDTEPGKNGVWIGPFKTTTQAEKFANEMLKPHSSKTHTCIK